MKKIVSLILVIALCCGALAAFAEDSWTGFWVLTHATVANGDETIEFDAEMLAANSLVMTMDLREDGTFTSTETTAELNQTLEGTWVYQDGSILLTFTDGGTQAIPIVDGELLIESGGGANLYMTRQAAEAADAA